MVVLELHRLIPGIEHAAASQTVCLLTADSQGVRLESADFDFDLSQKVTSLRTGEIISAADDAEEWARGLVAALRTPYLWADLKEDSNPLPDVEVKRTEIEDPALQSEPALH